MSFWDQRYAEPELAYGDQPNDFLRAVAHHLPPGPALCLAEGQGRNAVWLAQRGHAVTALDASPVGMARAHELAVARGVQIDTVVADLATWEGVAGGWSVIVATSAHLPPPIRARVHGLISTWLRPGGVLVLEAYRPDQLRYGTGGPPDVQMLYSAELLRQDLAGLEFLQLQEVDREVHEGRYHNGMAAVVQCLARKP